MSIVSLSVSRDIGINGYLNVWPVLIYIYDVQMDKDLHTSIKMSSALIICHMVKGNINISR